MSVLGNFVRASYVILFAFGLVLFLIGWTPGAVADYLKQTLPFYWVYIFNIFLWLGTTAMTTAVILGISELNPFRKYVEERLKNVIDQIVPTALKSITRTFEDRTSRDFVERATDVGWINEHVASKSLITIRNAIVSASIPGLDQSRHGLLQNYVYPVFEKPWRQDFRADIIYRAHENPKLLSVVIDCTWTGNSNEDLDIEQPLGMALPILSDMTVDEVKQSFSHKFLVGDEEVTIPWQFSEDKIGHKLIAKATFRYTVRRGGVQCRDRREYIKLLDDNYFAHRFQFLTENVIVSFSHPEAIKPRAYAFFLGGEPIVTEAPGFNRWEFTGWFLETHGFILFWPPTNHAV